MSAEDQPKKKKSVGVQTYARVRCFFPDREKIIRGVTTKSAKETGGKGVLTTLSSPSENVRPMTTQFTDVLGEKNGNEDCYKVICEPLIETTLQGFKALLIAYGQTGSGKTFSLIGAKGPGQLGLLPRTLKTLLEHEKVLNIKMKGFEAYSTGLKKIPLYDLFQAENIFSFKPFVKPGTDKVKNKQAEYKWVQKKANAAKVLWATKKGRTGYNTFKEGILKDIDTVEDGFRLVDEAHDASHFAKTGKNPESSRGHTVYILFIKIVHPQGEDYSPITTQFIVVDLAGSEGGSTLDALPDGADKTVRFLEGGVINYGLTALKDMFAEMRTKGKLKQSQGNGLRKLLYPFITMNTMMSICFTLSPSMENIMPTRATMKFAQDACKLKMKPVADSGGKNYQVLYGKLKDVLAAKEKLIEELQQAVEEGVDNASDVIADAAESGVVAEILGHMYHDKQDGVKALFEEYDLEQYVDETIIHDVEDEIQTRRDEYYNKLERVYIKHAPNKINNLYEILDKAIDGGMSMHYFYELECARHGEVPDARQQKNVAGSRVLSVARGLGVADANISKARRKTGLWMENAKLLRQKTSLAHDGHTSDLKKLEEELLSGISEHGGDEDLFKSANSGPIEVMSIAFEDVDTTQPPEVWSDFDEKMKADLLHKISDSNYVNAGQMTEKFEVLLKHEFALNEDEMDHLFGYLLHKYTEEHEQAQIADFSSEFHGGHGGNLTAEELQDLPRILEYQNRIHQLENDKRVEKSLKLWSNMRLKIRDRKLAQREKDVLNLERKITEKTNELQAIHKRDHDLINTMSEAFSKTGGVVDGSNIEDQLNHIMQAIEKTQREVKEITQFGGIRSSTVDPEIEAKLIHALNQVKSHEETISAYESLKESLETENDKSMFTHFASIQAKVSEKNLEVLTLQGRLEEIRDILRHQARKIDTLKQQIFIILHFPSTVEVEGRVGFNKLMNGTYTIGHHLHDGRVFYTHTENSWVLRWYDRKNLWILDHRGLNDDDIGSACVDDDAHHPSLIHKHWIVYDGVNFTYDPEIIISGSLKDAENHSEGSQKRGPGRN